MARCQLEAPENAVWEEEDKSSSSWAWAWTGRYVACNTWRCRSGWGRLLDQDRAEVHRKSLFLGGIRLDIGLSAVYSMEVNDKVSNLGFQKSSKEKLMKETLLDQNNHGKFSREIIVRAAWVEWRCDTSTTHHLRHPARCRVDFSLGAQRSVEILTTLRFWSRTIIREKKCNKSTGVQENKI